MGNTIRFSESRAYLSRDGYEIIGEISISIEQAKSILDNTSKYTVILGRSTIIDRCLFNTILNKHSIVYEYNTAQQCLVLGSTTAGIINDTHYSYKNEIEILYNIRKEDQNLINKLIQYLNIGVLRLVLGKYGIKDIYLQNRHNNSEYKNEYIDIKIHSHKQLLNLCKYYTEIGYSIKSIVYNKLKIYKE